MSDKPEIIPGTGPAPSRHLHLDFETYCALDLKKVGIRRYVRHPSFRVLCVAWRLGVVPVRAARIGMTVVGRYTRLPPDLEQLLKDPDVQAHAWNAAFESEVLEALGAFVANPLVCTMQRALAYGLPARLETAGRALKFGALQVKDPAGHKLMLKLSKPDRKTGVQPVPTEDEWKRLLDYCAQDVVAEEAVGDVIPQFGPEETALARLDADMNVSGIGVDLWRVNLLMAAAGAAEAQDAVLCSGLTLGDVTSPGTQTARLLSWLRGQGLLIDDVARATVEDALADITADPSHAGASAAVEEVLRIRLRAARGSTKKLRRMLDMADGGKLHWQFQFCGAGRTGRWSGRGVQPQNLPRVPKGFSPDGFARLIVAAGGAGTLNLSWLDAVSPANVLDGVSWSLRSCLMPEGRKGYYWGFDFSQIEARVLAWLAGQQDVLSVFQRGEDVYVWAAAQFGSTDRQLGKVLILALGFGMGAVKLRETARKGYGVALTAMQAEAFKTEWRLRNRHIVHFWYEMEAAARTAIVRRGTVMPVGGSGVAFLCTARTLQMRLPSGRVLYYHTPAVGTDGSISYWGTDVGGQWTKLTTYGGKLAENATQAAARDVMSEAMLRMFRRKGRVPAMSVHDELVYRLLGLGGAKPRQFDMDEMAAICVESPPWAGGLPIAGESKLMTRYGVLA